MCAAKQQPLRLRMLGSFEVLQGDEPVPEKAWGRKKTKDLFKILLSDPGHAFTQDQLIDLLYYDADPDKVVKNLRGRVSELRKALEPDLKKGPESKYILNVGQGYRFNDQADCWMDVHEFSRLCQTAQDLADTQRWPQAVEVYQQAIELYRGDFLEEDPYEEWAFAPREDFLEHYLKALEGLARCQGQLGAFQNAIECCQHILQKQVARESAFRLKMRFHHYAGEQQQALETYDACLQTLKDHLGVAPSTKTKRLHLQISNDQVPELEQITPNNLPVPPTELVGRLTELDQINEQLMDDNCRILTLVGPGGMGKTRLAMQAGSLHLERFPGGVFWVPLAAVEQAQSLPTAIADALKFNFFGRDLPQQQLANFLREKQLLLILDNFEQLTDAAALLNDILSQAPRVKCLITSRSRLNLKGEWTLPLQGLSVPDNAETDDADTFDAIRLFINNASQVASGFSLDQANKTSVIEICHLVEGSPLGIELAATWTEMLSPQEIVDEIKKNLDFLSTDMADTPERHRSMRATFEYSWQLLSEEERESVKKLAIFRGGFTREAADHVAGASLRILGSLLNKSFIWRSQQRYEIHELLRQYAEEKLCTDESVRQDTQKAHAHYYAAYLEQRERWLKGQDQARAIQDLGAEMDNARLAWTSMVEALDLEALSQSMGGFYQFQEMQGWFVEAESFFGQAIDRMETLNKRSKSFKTTLARAMAFRGHLCFHTGALDQAKEIVEQAHDLLPKEGTEHEQAFIHQSLGIIAESSARFDDAKQHLNQSHQLYKKCDDLYGQTMALLNLGVVGFDEGEYETAKAHYQTCMELCRQSGDRFGLAKVINNMGNVHYAMEQYKEAQPYYRESIELFREVSAPWGVHTALNNLGGTTNSLGDREGALKHFQDSLEVSRSIGYHTGTVMTLTNISDVEYTRGNYEASRQYIREGFFLALEMQVKWLYMDSMVFLGRQLHQEGRHQDALDLLTFLVVHHPMDYMRTLAQERLEEVKADVSDEMLTEAKRRAQDRPLADVVEQTKHILNEVSD